MLNLAIYNASTMPSFGNAFDNLWQSFGIIRQSFSIVRHFSVFLNDALVGYPFGVAESINVETMSA